MPLAPETKRERLYKFIRRKPVSSQGCRDWMAIEGRLTSTETEALLVELRDQGEIAFANGEWYVPDASRIKRRKPTKKRDPRQGRLFDDDE